MCAGRIPGLWPPSVGYAPWSRWEDTEEQMGQTRSWTRSLRNSLRGQGNPH